MVIVDIKTPIGINIMMERPVNRNDFHCRQRVDHKLLDIIEIFQELGYFVCPLGPVPYQSSLSIDLFILTSLKSNGQIILKGVKYIHYCV